MLSDIVKIREEWRPVEGWERLYEISSYGRVRSSDKRVRAGYGGNGWALRKGKILTPVEKGGRYLAVTLSDGVLRSQRLIHDLVARAFIGDKPIGQQVRHTDGDLRNNKAGNLAYGSALDNADDREGHGNTAKGEKHGMAELSPHQIIEIRGSSLRGVDLADIYGVSAAHISAIRCRRVWKHI